MEQTNKTVRKLDFEKDYRVLLAIDELLKQAIDEELEKLFAAMQKGDEEQKEKSKQRLRKLHTELGLGVTQK